MKRFVNGVEADLDDSAAEITPLHDRLMVRTAEGSFSAVAIRRGDAVEVSYRGQTYLIEKAKRTRSSHAGGDGELRAPMPGVIVDVLVEEGAKVTAGDKVLVLEAMKTQQPFPAPFDGVVSKLAVSKGQQVAEGELLATVVAEES